VRLRRQPRHPEVVVITGASAGVGRATVRAFAERGAHVGLIARNSEALEAAQREVEACGGKALVCVADVADASAVEAAADAIEQQLGPIDVWVNNAMITIMSPISALQPDEVKRVTEVTYLGTVYGTLAALKRMRPRNRGVIVQVGSALAYRAIPLQAPYCGAKFAIRGFTDSLRTELKHERSRVHVTMLQMPALNTPQFDWCRTHMAHRPQPVPPIFAPEVAARAIVWAAHHRRRELYVGWPSVRAIWAQKLMPGLLDRYLARFGYSSQQSNEPVDSARSDNMWQTVPGDHGAAGRFGKQARPVSRELWMTTHRSWIGGIAVVILAVTTFAWLSANSLRETGNRPTPK
jgi:short-subunit dehydrogenase